MSVEIAAAVSVTSAVLGAFGAYRQARAAGVAQRQQAITDQLRGESTRDDLAFARIELDMTGTQIGMADGAIAAQLAGQSSRQAKLSLDRDMIDLEAEQAEQSLRLGLRIQQGEEIAAAAGMGIDPFASASFATMALEQRRMMEQSAANIRINGMAARGQITLEQANEFGSTAALLQQQGALQMEQMNIARGAISLAHQERMANYSIRVAQRNFSAGSAAINSAWVAGAQSLFSSYVQGGGRAGTFSAGVNSAASATRDFLSRQYRTLTLPTMRTPPT